MKKISTKRLIQLFSISVFFLCIHSLNAQNTEFELFERISQNPSDSVALEQIEDQSEGNSWRELIYILRSNCQLNRPDKVKGLLIELAGYDFDLTELTKVLKRKDVLLDNCFDNDSPFIIDFNNALHENRKRIEKDTVFILLEKMYELDQLTRGVFRLKRDYNLLNEVDSMNLVVIDNWLSNGEITSKRIGFHNEQNMYIILFHRLRDIEELEYERIRTILYQLVLQDEFNPNYDANIVDERLRRHEPDKYPMYNFLRGETVSKEKAIEIRKNCMLINGFK